jgi:NAD(P)-dependent dehydrogenase (short-subunit alcohol dehydrogenase family)
LSPLRLCQLVMPDMKERGRGVILNVTSVSGLTGMGRPPQAGYVATKHALTGLTRELALQWGRYGIRVNALAPGFFASAATELIFGNESTAAWIDERMPLQFRATPHDFQAALLFLVSDASRFMTGQTVSIDGGWTAS